MIPDDLDLYEHVAAQIEACAEEVIDDWLVELGRRLRVQDIRLLPTDAMRDHLPLVVRSVAGALRLPKTDAADPVIHEIRLVTELRREQGYPVVEVLREFQILAEIIFARVVSLLEHDDQSWQIPGVARLFEDLNRATGSIGMNAVETYQEAFMREKQKIASQLADFALTLEREVRAPLHEATASVDLLSLEQVAGDPERLERYTGILRSRLERITQLIGDVRELSVAERALAQETRKSVREVIQEVSRELEAAATERGVQIVVVEPIAEIRVDPVVEVALMNLISNAVKYSDPNEPDRWVEISLRTVGNVESPRWQLLVRDNGVGIPAGLQHEVFQRGVRLHPDLAQGTGWGLSIVKEIMEQRGGSVAVESKEGEGATFILEMTPRLAEPEVSGSWSPSRGESEDPPPDDPKSSK